MEISWGSLFVCLPRQPVGKAWEWCKNPHFQFTFRRTVILKSHLASSLWICRGVSKGLLKCESNSKYLQESRWDKFSLTGMTSAIWSISLTIGSYSFGYNFLWPLYLSLCSNRMTHIDNTTRVPCPSSLVESFKQISLPLRWSYPHNFLLINLFKFFLFSSFQQWGTTSCLKQYFQISVASLNFRMGNQLTLL